MSYVIVNYIVRKRLANRTIKEIRQQRYYLVNSVEFDRENNSFYIDFTAEDGTKTKDKWLIKDVQNIGIY